MNKLEYLRLDQVSNFPDFMAAIHIDLTWNPAAECRYLTSASTLDRSYAMYAKRDACWVLACLGGSKPV